MICHLSVGKSKLILPFGRFKVKKKELGKKQQSVGKQGKFIGKNNGKLRKNGKVILAFSAFSEYNKLIYYTMTVKGICRVSKKFGSAGI